METALVLALPVVIEFIAGITGDLTPFAPATAGAVGGIDARIDRTGACVGLLVTGVHQTIADVLAVIIDAAVAIEIQRSTTTPVGGWRWRRAVRPVPAVA
jgi:hypothetical protein